MPARRSASSSKTFTIDNDCTRPWAIARQPRSKQCYRSLGLIHGVINKPRQQQQTQQVPSSRVSAKGCTPVHSSAPQRGFPFFFPVRLCYFRQNSRFYASFCRFFNSPPPPLQGFAGTCGRGAPCFLG